MIGVGGGVVVSEVIIGGDVLLRDPVGLAI